MNRSTSVELGAFECRRSPTRSAQLCALVLLVTAQVANAEVALPSTIGLAGRRLLAADQLEGPAQTVGAAAAAPEVYWVLLVGDSQSGKTSLVNRLLSDTFSAQYKATEGAFSKQHALTGSPIILQIWDTAGQEAFRKVVTSIYRGVHAVLVTYDPRNQTSFDSAQKLWLPEVKEFAEPNAIKLLVSTKGDLANATVVTTEAQQVADAAGVELISTSALNNQNVTSLFHRLGEDIYARRHPSTSQS